MDASDNYQPASEYQQTTSQQCFRFMDADEQYELVFTGGAFLVIFYNCY